MSCADTPNGTILLALEDGPTPCDSPDGATTGRSSRAARRASRSATPGGGAGSPTSGTSPLFGSSTSASSALLSSLASRLRERLPSTTGSTICSTRWSWKVTPRGRWYCQLVASVPRTSGSGSGSSRTVWATPMARDWRSGRTSEATLSKNTRPLSEQVEALTVWPTPIAGDARDSANHGGGTLKLLGAARLASWPTPQVDSFRSRGGDRKHEMGLDQLVRSIPEMGPARITADGALRTGSSAGTARGGRLNPAHSRWLMGYPAAWDDCAPTATPSSRKSRPKS